MVLMSNQRDGKCDDIVPEVIAGLKKIIGDHPLTVVNGGVAQPLALAGADNAAGALTVKVLRAQTGSTDNGMVHAVDLKGLDLGEVGRAIREVPEVEAVHHLHVWTIASGIFAASVHVAVNGGSVDRDCLTWEIEEILRHRFGLEHNTIQLEGPNFADPQACLLHRLNGGHP